MGIFKEHLYDIVRLYINQIGITIFSVFLYTAIPTEDDSLFDTLRIVVSVFAILFYLVLIHNVMWEIGAKDKIRIDSKGYEPKPLKGMIMALYANVPNLVFASFAVIFGVTYIASGAGWSASVFAVLFMVVKFHAAMYMGVIQGVTPAAPADPKNMAVFTDAVFESVWFIVLPLVAVGLTQLSYWLGTKERKLFGFLSSNTSKK